MKVRYGGGLVEIRDIKMPDSSARPPVHMLSRPMLLYVYCVCMSIILLLTILEGTYTFIHANHGLKNKVQAQIHDWGISIQYIHT